MSSSRQIPRAVRVLLEGHSQAGLLPPLCRPSLRENITSFPHPFDRACTDQTRPSLTRRAAAPLTDRRTAVHSFVAKAGNRQRLAPGVRPFAAAPRRPSFIELWPTARQQPAASSTSPRDSSRTAQLHGWKQSRASTRGELLPTSLHLRPIASPADAISDLAGATLRRRQRRLARSERARGTLLIHSLSTQARRWVAPTRPQYQLPTAVGARPRGPRPASCCLPLRLSAAPDPFI
jgi:hypothetical protein